MRIFANLNKLILPLLAAWATVFSGAAVASDCFYLHFTLEKDYRRADSIVVAHASGCPDSQLPISGRCPDQLYSFDVIEVLKDSVPSRDHGGVIQGSRKMGCGMYFRIGHSYLLFIDENGNLNHGASGYLSADDARSIATEERLQILRQYRDHMIEDLSGPWRFFDHGRACHVNHSFEGGSLSFSYVYAKNDYHGSARLVSSRGPNGEYRLDSGPPTPEEESFHAKMTGPTYERNAVSVGVSLGELLNTFKAVE